MIQLEALHSIKTINIGYGQIFPKTEAGMMFCIGYALVGIPLLLVFMANVGDLMATSVKWIYRFIF